MNKTNPDEFKNLHNDAFIHEIGEQVSLIIHTILISLQKQNSHAVKKIKNRYKIRYRKTEKISNKIKYEQEKKRILNEWENF